MWLKLKRAFSIVSHSHLLQCESLAARDYVFNALVFSAEVLVSSTKRVRLYRQVSLNALVARPVVSDKRFRLHCGIVFGSEPGLPRLARGRVHANYTLLNDICQNLGRSGPSNIKLHWYGLDEHSENRLQDVNKWYGMGDLHVIMK